MPLNSRWLRPIFNRLLAPICVCCHYPSFENRNICTACQQALPQLPHTCMVCAGFIHSSLDTGLICGTCLQTPPPFDLTHALFPYQAPVIHLVTQLKFQHQLSHARALSELFIERIPLIWYAGTPLPDLIIPVPLHNERLRERGFNQALEIAKPIARALKMPLDTHYLQRIRSTAAQSGLTAKARKKNVAGAFAVKDQHRFDGMTLAVIDDVITTGQTMRECCRVLKECGAKAIHVWCCARRG